MFVLKFHEPVGNTMSQEMIFRNTHAHTGRLIAVTPANSAMRHLSYGRIVLGPSQPSEAFSTGACETGLICLSGEATVTLDSEEISLGRFDSLYIPRNSSVRISTESRADLAEFSTPVAGKYSLQHVRYSDIEGNPGLSFGTGTAGCTRRVNMLLGKNIQAGRLIAGFTTSEPGNWTSWPPHEHSAMLEEIYVFFDMPYPAFGIQMVYENTEQPELVTVVRDGDAVLMPAGFHPNVSVPGHRICFLWAMAAYREVEDRQFGVVNVQRGFDQHGSGLEAGRTK
jgi:5-deoxy-glucuronate isomerase